MPKSKAICIGLNSVDPAHYNGWSGYLRGCEADARSMAQIAHASGFEEISLLITADATRQRVLDELKHASDSLDSGDILFISCSSHGGTLPDMNGDEDDSQDETWCLYDGQIVDDELNFALCSFKPGIRILSIVDACHAGTPLKQFARSTMFAKTNDLRSANNTEAIAFRAMNFETAASVYLANKEFYDSILKNPAFIEAKTNVAASVLTLGACQDNQLSADGLINGRFTGLLLATWNGGKFSGSYTDFIQKIVAAHWLDQTPKMSTFGGATDTFIMQKPFSI